MRLGGLVLAAGLSSRMGAFKPLMQIDGKALVVLSVESLLQKAESVTVVLGFRADEVRQALRDAFPKERVRITVNAAYEMTDMLQSIRTGLAELDECDAFFLLPGDMPAVGISTLAALAAALENTDAAVAVPTVEGRRKHPPLIRADCIGDILSYDGEGGLRGIWRGYEGKIAAVPVNDRGCVLDADDMDDFLALSDYLRRKRNTK